MGRLERAAAAAIVLLAIGNGTSPVQAESIDATREKLLQKMKEIDAQLEAQGVKRPRLGLTGDPQQVSPGGNVPEADLATQCQDIVRFLKIAMERGDTARTNVGIYTHQLYGCGRKGFSGVLGAESLAID